jgi:hypothetical protein
MEKIKNAIKFLDEQVIDFVNEGKWNGKFSDVRKRVEHVMKFLSDVQVAQPVVERLHCAAHLLEGNPDVKKLKLDAEAKNGKISVPEGCHKVFNLQNVGIGNNALEPGNFTHCFQPAVQTVTTEGDGTATIPNLNGTQIDYHCTGPGQVRLTASMGYKPLTVVALSTNGNQANVSAAAVSPGTPDLTGTVLSFALDQQFKIDQIALAVKGRKLNPDRATATPTSPFTRIVRSIHVIDERLLHRIYKAQGTPTFDELMAELDA